MFLDVYSKALGLLLLTLLLIDVGLDGLSGEALPGLLLELFKLVFFRFELGLPLEVLDILDGLKDLAFLFESFSSSNFCMFFSTCLFLCSFQPLPMTVLVSESTFMTSCNSLAQYSIDSILISPACCMLATWDTKFR